MIFVEETCITCGILFCITDGWKAQLKRTHAQFYCPAGHVMYYTAKTDAEILREQLAMERLEIVRLTNDLKNCKRKKKKSQ